ncbi:MAG: tetratricopeptide repeat protein [Lysobacterales bacterium]
MLSKTRSVIMATALVFGSTVAHADGLGAYSPMFLIQAEQALESGDTSRTIELLNRRYKRLRSPEDRIRGYAALCGAYLSEKDLQMASWACGHAAEMDLAGWSDFNNRGVLELHLGQFDDALASFERARMLNPDSLDVQKNVIKTRSIKENKRVSSAQ